MVACGDISCAHASAVLPISVVGCERHTKRLVGSKHHENRGQRWYCARHDTPWHCALCAVCCVMRCDAMRCVLRAGEPHIFIHYKGWKDKYDEAFPVREAMDPNSAISQRYTTHLPFTLVACSHPPSVRCGCVQSGSIPFKVPPTDALR